MGTTALSWIEVRTLLTSTRYGSYVTEHRNPGTRLLSPEMRVMTAIADATRAANWQRTADRNAPPPPPIWQEIYPPEPEPADEEATDRLVEATPEAFARIRAEIAARRKIAVPADGPRE